MPYEVKIEVICDDCGECLDSGSETVDSLNDIDLGTYSKPLCEECILKKEQAEHEEYLSEMRSLNSDYRFNSGV